MARLSGGDKFSAALADLDHKLNGPPAVLRVGFLAGATYPDGTSVPLVAALNEYGHGIGKAPAEGEADTRDRVPPRPFFRNMIAAKSPGWPKAISGLLKSTNYDIKATLLKAGEGIKGQLQQSIKDLVDPPLAPSTIKAKGFAKPLIDTGHMLNSVDYEVKTE